MKKHTLPVLESVTLDNYSLDIQHYLQKEYTEVGEASVELPTLIEWINYQLQVQIEEKHRIKAALGRAEASAFFELKNGDYQRKGYGEKSTETGLAHAITLDETVTRINEDFAIVTGWVARLENLLRSFQSKLELVRSSEATRRKSFDMPTS